MTALLPPQPLLSASAQGFGIPEVVADLAEARADWRARHHRSQEPGGRELPSLEQIEEILDGLRAVLFPMRLGPRDLRQENENAFVARTLEAVLRALSHQIWLELRWQNRFSALRPTEEADEGRARALVRDFAAGLGGVRRLLDTDVSAAFDADPAAQSVDEVLLCYPGTQATIIHRLAHRLDGLGLPLIARLVAEIGHSRTGIDIHPAARIGERFFIDHGTGVVIGATAIIGDRVTLYQAVTLGARSFPTDPEGRALKGLPRHPVVEDDVTIYAGATILGRVTIGRGAIIGGNTWITADVPPGSIVAQAASCNPG